MDKKGTETSAEGMKVVVLLLLIAVVAGAFVYLTLQKADESAGKSECKSSVQANALARSKWLGISWDQAITCPTQEKKVPGKNEKKAFRMMADEMYKCWDNFGRGKLELFPTESGTETDYCVLCTVMEFDTKGKELHGFWNFLIEEDAPLAGHSYYQEFTGIAPTDVVENADGTKTTLDNFRNDEKNMINTDHSYAVMYTYSKETGIWDRKWKGGVLGTVGLVAGLVAGSFVPGGFMITVPAALALGGAAGGGGFAYGLFSGPSLSAGWQPGIHLIPYDSGHISKLGCTELPVKQTSE
jgi:hypothetical protein